MNNTDIINIIKLGGELPKSVTKVKLVEAISELVTIQQPQVQTTAVIDKLVTVYCKKYSCRVSKQMYKSQAAGWACEQHSLSR